MNTTTSVDINAAYPFATAKRVAGAIAMQRLSRGEKDEREPFYVIDLEPVVSLYQTWKTSLPCVEPHYAVKCNPNPALLRVLNGLGAGFDCASSDEIDGWRRWGWARSGSCLRTRARWRRRLSTRGRAG